MKSSRERAEERRQQRLEDVERQVRSGSLTIRSMTPEERLRYPVPDPDRPITRRGRWI